MGDTQKRDDLAEDFDKPLQTAMRARIELLDPRELSDQDGNIYQSILRTRGSLDGPFLAWLHSPKLADPAEKLGAFCRYGTQLPQIESELLILIVSAHFRCTGEWQIHEPIARGAGIDAKTIEAIRAGGLPGFTEPRLGTLYSFARELLSLQRVSDQVFAQASERFGDQAVVEIVGILGYYSLVAMTLNAFEMHFADADDPFKADEAPRFMRG